MQVRMYPHLHTFSRTQMSTNEGKRARESMQNQNEHNKKAWTSSRLASSISNM